MSAEYDVIVLGAGPAGLMAAGFAAEAGASVLVLEKNSEPGRKLCVTGGGRGNLTHAEFDARKLAACFGPASRALLGPFSRFGPAEVLDFFAARGLACKTEADGRVFPECESAKAIRNVLVKWLKELGVVLQCNCNVQKVASNSESAMFEVSYIEKTGRQTPRSCIAGAQSLVLATGGEAMPSSGSTGDGFRWLAELGYAVQTVKPILVPMKIRESWLADLKGLALPDVAVTLAGSGAEKCTSRGAVMFTHYGLSGPAILNMAGSLPAANPAMAADPSPPADPAPAKMKIMLDFFPDMERKELDRHLQELLAANPRKQLSKVLEMLLPSRLAARVLLTDCENPNASSVSRALRLNVIDNLKCFPLTFDGLLGKEAAIATVGGVGIDDVDFRTMQLKGYPGLFVIGDMLDIQRPTGGYSLQLAWSTAFVAGAAAARS